MDLGIGMESGSSPLFDWATIHLPLTETEKTVSYPAQLHAAALRRPVAVTEPSWPKKEGAQLELDLTGGIVALVPRERYRLLTYRLTEYLVHACGTGFMRYGFALEQGGIAYLGDLVQLEDFAARRWIRSERLFYAVKRALVSLGLDFGMSAPRWDRPVDDFTHRHWLQFSS